MPSQSRPPSIDHYTAAFPSEVQDKLRSIRQIIRESAPEATESISYGLPAYKLYGKPLLYFGAYQHHISLYPLPSQPDINLLAAIEPYRSGKGTLKLPLGQPLPTRLIERIVKHQVRVLSQHYQKEQS